MQKYHCQSINQKAQKIHYRSFKSFFIAVKEKHIFRFFREKYFRHENTCPYRKHREKEKNNFFYIYYHIIVI